MYLPHKENLSVMDDGSKPPLASLVILLCFSAFLAFAETAIASVSRNKIKISAERGDSRAKYALYALDRFEDAITTLLICNNITSISIATIVTVWVTKRWSIDAVAISTVVTTAVIFFACEMLPKSFAKKYSFKTALACSTLLVILMKIFSPFAKLLSKIGAFASRRIREEEASVTEDELQDIIEDMAEEGTLDEEQSELIQNAVQFGDVRVGSILTPRINISAIDVEDSPQEIYSLIKNQNHSRLPVYEGTIDNIIGVLNVRKYWKTFMKEGKTFDIRRHLDDVYFAPKDAKIDELLPLMSKHKINIAVIKDEYGGTLGLVSVEDILEELVGDIWDESDVVSETPEASEEKEETAGFDLSEELSKEEEENKE